MIEMAIGLSLVYLQLSIITSGFQELIAHWLERRGRWIRTGLEQLLGVSTTLTAPKGSNPHAKDILGDIYKHPLISSLKSDPKGQPSYIPPSNFALALVDTLSDKYASGKPLFEGLPQAISRMPECNLRRLLHVLVSQSKGDAAVLQKLIEDQFNATMERVSGWYKRRTHLWLFAIALAVAIVGNVDTIGIAQRLARDSELRSQLSNEAAKIVKVGLATTNGEDAKIAAEIQKGFKSLFESGAPIGWHRSAQMASKDPQNHDSSAGTSISPGCLQVYQVPKLCASQVSFQVWLGIAFGWLLSALAAMLGSPFWFDVISKLVPLRSSGTKPADASKAQENTPSTATSAPSASTPTSGEAATVPVKNVPLNDFEATFLTVEDIEGLHVALGTDQQGNCGEIDNTLRDALRRWQRRVGQPESGVFDERTVLTILYGDQKE